MRAEGITAEEGWEGARMDSKAAREKRRGAVPKRLERQGRGSYQGLGGLGAHEAECRMGVLNGAHESVLALRNG